MAVRLCLNAMIRSGRDAVLVPIPQYPLYSASIRLYGTGLLYACAWACVAVACCETLVAPQCVYAWGLRDMPGRSIM